MRRASELRAVSRLLLGQPRGNGGIGRQRLRVRSGTAGRGDRHGEHTRTRDQRLLAARRRRPRRSREEPLDAVLQLPVAADRNPLPRQAPAVAANIVGDVDEHARVVSRRAARAAGGLVTRELRDRGELALQPPRQRVEPEHAAIDTRHEREERISSDDVRAFMRDHRVKGCRGPRAPGRRQNDPRLEDAGGERRGDDRRLVGDGPVGQPDGPRLTHDRGHRQPARTDVDQRCDQTRQI